MNNYTEIIVDEATRRGIDVEVLDDELGELMLRFGGREVRTIQSLSELTSALAFRTCDRKGRTREVLARAGVSLPRGRMATFDDADRAFLAEIGELVVKPAQGEGGVGITVGVTDDAGLATALAAAAEVCSEVLLEERYRGHDLRVVVIDGEVVAASERRPPTVTGDGTRTLAELIDELSAARSAATDGAAEIPLDQTTLDVLAAAGHAPDDVLERGVTVEVRLTANVHTGGTIVDVTDDLHPALARAALAGSSAIRIPVVGVDLMVAAVDRPDHVVIEANEQPGLANHEPRPTAERFIDLLFPETSPNG